MFALCIVHTLDLPFIHLGKQTFEIDRDEKLRRTNLKGVDYDMRRKVSMYFSSAYV